MTIAICPGHHEAKPGIQIAEFNEHIEAVIWAHFIAQDLGNLGLAIPAGVLRDRLTYLHALHPEFAVEIHFSQAEHFTIKHQCKNAHSVILAEILMGLTNGASSERFQVAPGYYHDDFAYGEDYFLAKAPCTALIFEAPVATATDPNRRAALCSALASSLATMAQNGVSQAYQG